MSEAKKYLDQAGLDAFWLKVKANAAAQASAAQEAAEAKAAEAKAAAEAVATDLAGNYYDKTAVDSKVKAVSDKVSALGAVLNFKGTVENTKALPSTGNNEGDVWHVTDNSGEYVWVAKNGDVDAHWEELGSTVNLDGYLTKADAESTYAKPADIKITGVQVNGKDLTITGKKVNVTVATGGANGTIAVNGADVAVKGLGSAAYTASTAYATSAQGAKADTALQPGDIAAIDVEYINNLS